MSSCQDIGEGANGAGRCGQRGTTELVPGQGRSSPRQRSPREETVSLRDCVPLFRVPSLFALSYDVYLYGI